LNQVKIIIKEIDYSMHQKIITLMMSIAVGCKYSQTSTISLYQSLFLPIYLIWKCFPLTTEDRQLEHVSRVARTYITLGPRYLMAYMISFG